MNGKYDDMMHLPHPVSATRSRMSAWDRAAQFSPFAALTGYEDAIAETGRLTDAKEEISENRSMELDRSMHELLNVLDACPKVRITRFLADRYKDGGTYVTGYYRIRKIDQNRREIWTEEGDRICMDDIWELTLI